MHKLLRKGILVPKQNQQLKRLKYKIDDLYILLNRIKLSI